MEANESPTVTSKQAQLIALLVAGVAIATAAKNIGIGETTAHRWLKLPHFQQAYRAAKDEIFNEVLQGLKEKVAKAIETLDRNMDSDAALPPAQIRAAQLTIELALSIHKTSELEARLAELEERLKER